MARKPNWKRRGLPKPITDGDREKLRKEEELRLKINKAPKELQEFLSNNPGYII